MTKKVRLSLLILLACLVVSSVVSSVAMAQDESIQQAQTPWGAQASFTADWLPGEAVSSDEADAIVGTYSGLTAFGIKMLARIVPNAIAKKLDRFIGRSASFSELYQATGSYWQATLYYLSPLLLSPGIAY